MSLHFGSWEMKSLWDTRTNKLPSPVVKHSVTPNYYYSSHFSFRPIILVPYSTILPLRLARHNFIQHSDLVELSFYPKRLQRHGRALSGSQLVECAKRLCT